MKFVKLTTLFFLGFTTDMIIRSSGLCHVRRFIDYDINDPELLSKLDIALNNGMDYFYNRKLV